MRVTRYKHRTTISCSAHEYDILAIAVSELSAESDPAKWLPTTGLRRSWARRANAGPFLRIDHTRRTK